MKKIWILLLFAGPLLWSQQNQKTIRGMVTDGRAPLSNVSIAVEQSGTQTYSDETGRYEIDADAGDILVYSYQGMKTLKIRVEDVTRILNPEMVMDVAQLDEVVVIGSNRKTQKELAMEYSQNERLIRTAFGILNADTAPGNIRFMNERQINPVYLCILDLLRNQFAGVEVRGSCTGATGPGAITGQLTNIAAVPQADADSFQEFDNTTSGKVFIRGTSSVFNPRSAIFDVDGQLFNDPPLWLDVKQIKRLAILNNFATTTIYGNIGAGGVIVINTLTGSPRNNEIVDMARLRNNYVSGPVLQPDEVAANAPSYIKALRDSDAGSLQATYQEYASRYGGSPYFFLDAYRHFYEERKQPEQADALLQEHSYLFEKNPVLLKALAYIYQAQNRQAKANEIYKEVLRLRPNYAQSYMDLANSYRELGDYEKAAAIYKRYDYMVGEGIMPRDSVSLFPIINRDFNNLLSLHQAALVSSEKRSDLFVDEEDFEGTRLVFEWNDGEAEFDLQFVNPGGQYFKWSHSLASDAEGIMLEKELGYSTKEYLIDDSLPGTWKVNINYSGNKSLTPTYLKVTVYNNYGSPGQTKQTKVYKLFLKDVNQELFRLTKGSTLAFN